jgi:hypothetical protein
MATVRARAGGRRRAAVPHVPDGLLTLPSAQGPERWAVVVALTRKPAAEYARILRWYAAELAYQRVVWFAGRDAVRRALARLIARERLDDFVQVQPLPRGVAV